ncbi:hypothetical protein SK128_010796 [Halocaridina rubra]|uniref:PLAT domain-containing protein n=1 Tax=Halocaridina rubra TaxID=373956 RepID=A0AAN8WI19_HALRR
MASNTSYCNHSSALSLPPMPCESKGLIEIPTLTSFLCHHIYRSPFISSLASYPVARPQVVYADYFKTKCQTTHLTSFSSGFFVAPNSIDFSYVFANMGFADNLTINITLILCLATLLCMMVWARLKDKKDLTKLGASPMTDNKAEDKYLYEMMVFTGDKVEAQTDSVVQFILSGEDDETDIRVLEDSTRKILQKGAVDIFIMAVPRPLGSLEFLRIWHDNSGKGPNASWYLSYIVLKDLQTGDKFTFVAEKWFGIEKGDGEIDKLITVAGKEQMTNFTHLFNVSSSKSFTDGHLWFSVFLRPPRCQRLGSCFALLYLSMVVNAMWYQTVPESPGTGGLQLGPFSLSPEQIGVGVMSNLIIFIPSLIIVQLFRKARPRTLRKSRVQEALEKTRKIPSNKNQTLENETIKRPLSSVTTSSDAIIKRRKKKSTLPWWTRIIAWILVWVCILASITFVYFYGISFGNTKATKWVTSLVISFFSSVLFVQPIKIVLVTLFVSLISKPDNLDDDDADEDEEDPELESDEAWLHPKVGGPRESKMTHKKTDPVALQRHREQRQKELEMHAIIKELLSYFIFLWLLYILSYGNRNPNDFYLNQSLMQSFINEDAIDESKDFTKVTDTSALWNYFMDAFLEALRTKELYNGAPPLGLKGFFKDTVNRILGYATIRQIRTKENTCR